MPTTKLIVLNGFAAAGKSTIAKLYIAEHSLAMALEADTLVDGIGDWANHKEEVRQLTFQLTKAMLRTYLPSGHDVILPYTVTRPKEVEEFELIARECGADYYEFVLHNERVAAIERLLQRGSWGEETSPALTEKDLPEIEDLMDRMEAALHLRPQAIQLPLTGQSPEATYQQLISHLH
jgi:predicted kinase